VKWDNRSITGILGVSPLRRTTDVVPQRKGGDQSVERLSPGLTRYDPVVIERGVTHDHEFEAWADKVWDLNAIGGQETSADFRKDIVIELYNEAGQLVIAYRLLRCWPSEYTALPQLDACGREVAIESLTLENEGWERDRSISEPKEPSA
jgi:phage tail-like protein